MFSSISTPLDVQALIVERADKSAKKTCCAIHWVEIYLVESVIQPSNNRGQVFSQENPVFVVLISFFFQFFFFISSFVNLFLKGDAKYAIDISLALSKILTSV